MSVLGADSVGLPPRKPSGPPRSFGSPRKKFLKNILEESNSDSGDSVSSEGSTLNSSGSLSSLGLSSEGSTASPVPISMYQERRNFLKGHFDDYLVTKDAKEICAEIQGLLVSESSLSQDSYTEDSGLQFDFPAAEDSEKYKLLLRILGTQAQGDDHLAVDATDRGSDVDVSGICVTNSDLKPYISLTVIEKCQALMSSFNTFLDTKGVDLERWDITPYLGEVAKPKLARRGSETTLRRESQLNDLNVLNHYYKHVKEESKNILLIHGVLSNIIETFHKRLEGYYKQGLSSAAAADLADGGGGAAAAVEPASAEQGDSSEKAIQEGRDLANTYFLYGLGVTLSQIPGGFLESEGVKGEGHQVKLMTAFGALIHAYEEFQKISSIPEDEALGLKQPRVKEFFKTMARIFDVDKQVALRKKLSDSKIVDVKKQVLDSTDSPLLSLLDCGGKEREEFMNLINLCCEATNSYQREDQGWAAVKNQEKLNLQFQKWGL